MNELYRIIEDKIKNAGYPDEISGQYIYDEVSDFIEDKEAGTYLFISKDHNNLIFEYKIDVLDDEFNLSYLKITTPEKEYLIDFDN